MGHYFYLLGGLYFTLPAVYILFKRPDLCSLGVKAGLMGALAGLIFEPVFLSDYWRPETVLGIGKVSVEDCLFSFGVTALAVCLYPFLTKQKSVLVVKSQAVLTIIIALSVSLITIILPSLTPLNSEILNSALLVLAAGVILIIRPDLWRASLITALALTLISLVMYLVALDILDTSYEASHWLLSGTFWGKTVLGHVPFTELTWYFGWGMLAGVLYPFLRGKKFIKLEA